MHDVCYQRWNSFPSILKISFSVVGENFRVTVWLGTLQHFLTPLCRCQNDLFFSALNVSFNFLFHLCTGKLESTQTESPSPGPACFLGHRLGCRPLISTGRKQIGSEVQEKGENKISPHPSPQIEKTSSAFPDTRNQFWK